MGKFYTKTGDDGQTGWLSAGRLPKYHPRIETVGAVDEATAALGLARATCAAPEIAPVLIQVQRDLYSLMAELAADKENAARFRQIDAARVQWLETQTDQFAEQVTMPKAFILPGETPGGGALSLARAIVRRAERRVVALFDDAMLENIHLQRYLNRLSSLCFVLELYENAHQGSQTQQAKG